MRKLPTLLALWLISGACHAADNGFYFGAGIGVANFTTDGNVDADSETSYKLIGGFRLLDRLALEVNYADFGKAGLFGHYAQCGGQVCAVGDTVEPTALGGFLVGFLNFPLLDAFAKLGVASVEARTNVSGVSAKDDTTDVAWGAGIQAHFGSFAVRGEYEQYKYELNLSHGVRLYSVSFLYTFL